MTLRSLRVQQKVLTQGKFLAIDPSSGSISRSTGERSNAGWAIFEQGRLSSSGIITIDGTNKTQRLQDLANTLLVEFDESFDLLILEDIWGYIAPQTLVQACGVIIATSGAVNTVEVNVKQWQGVANRLGGWTKGDENDAVWMGVAAICLASGYSHKALKKDPERLAFLNDLAKSHDYWGVQEIEEHHRTLPESGSE